MMLWMHLFCELMVMKVRLVVNQYGIVIIRE